jgi:hypothetical protein
MDKLLVVIDHHASGEWAGLDSDTVCAFQPLDEFPGHGRVAVEAMNWYSSPMVLPDLLLQHVAVRGMTLRLMGMSLRSMCGVQVHVESLHSTDQLFRAGPLRLEQY